MSEEELEKVKGIVKRLFAGTGVTIGDIVDTAPWLDKLVNEVEELQKEIKNGDERNYILGLDFIQIGEKLGLENFGTQAILLGIDKLQRENKEYQELTDNLRGENAELRDDLDKKQKENEELKTELSKIQCDNRQMENDNIKLLAEISDLKELLGE